MLDPEVWMISVMDQRKNNPTPTTGCPEHDWLFLAGVTGCEDNSIPARSPQYRLSKQKSIVLLLVWPQLYSNSWNLFAFILGINCHVKEKNKVLAPGNSSFSKSRSSGEGQVFLTCQPAWKVASKWRCGGVWARALRPPQDWGGLGGRSTLIHHCWLAASDTLRIIPCFFFMSSTAVQGLVGLSETPQEFQCSCHFQWTLYYPQLCWKNKNLQTTNHPFSMWNPYTVSLFHAPQPARTSSASSSLWWAPLAAGPSSFSFFSSLITLLSLSASPEDVTFPGFQALPTQCFPTSSNTFLFIL